MASKTFYELYKLALGMNAEQVQTAFNLMTATANELISAINATSLFTSSAPNNNDHTSSYFYSLAYIGPSLKANSFGDNATKMSAYEEGAKFLSFNPVKVKDLKLIIEAGQSEDASRSVYYFVNTLVPELEAGQFARIHVLSTEEVAATKATTVHAVQQIGLSVDESNLNAIVKLSASIGTSSMCSYNLVVCFGMILLYIYLYIYNFFVCNSFGISTFSL